MLPHPHPGSGPGGVDRAQARRHVSLDAIQMEETPETEDAGVQSVSNTGKGRAGLECGTIEDNDMTTKM